MVQERVGGEEDEGRGDVSERVVWERKAPATAHGVCLASFYIRIQHNQEGCFLDGPYV